MYVGSSFCSMHMIRQTQNDDSQKQYIKSVISIQISQLNIDNAKLGVSVAVRNLSRVNHLITI